MVTAITAFLWFLVVIFTISAALSWLILRHTPGAGGTDEEDENIQRRLQALREEWIMQNRGPIEDEVNTEQGGDPLNLMSIFESPQFNQLLGQQQAKNSLQYRLGKALFWLGLLIVTVSVIALAVALGIGLAHLIAWI